MLTPLKIVCGGATSDVVKQVYVEVTNACKFPSFKPGRIITITFYDKSDNQSYLELIERCGSRFSDLSFNLEEHTLKRVSRPKNKMDASGWFLDHIFKYCTNMTHLTLQGTKLINCNPNMSANNSIQYLSLWNVKLYKNVLSQLSIRPPSLKCLILTHYCAFAFPDGVASRGTNFCFEMVNTVFDTFALGSSMMTEGGNIDRLCIGIQPTMEPHRYFHVYFNSYSKKYETIETDLRQYGASIGDFSCASICIRCKSIKTVKVNWDIYKKLSCEIAL